jgi:hypothetical protein
MARPIDADALQELCNRRIQDTWNSRAAPLSWAAAYANFKDDIDSMSTLTPPNEWVEALEAINNAAVAYIEGGPYENDLPGMELAVEIDRLSRDFVRPPNEPLTLEQLREMDGEPVWVEDVKHWALIDIEKGGQWDGVPFAIWAENGMKFTYNIKNRGLHCYRRPPEGEA